MSLTLMVLMMMKTMSLNFPNVLLFNIALTVLGRVSNLPSYWIFCPVRYCLLEKCYECAFMSFEARVAVVMGMRKEYGAACCSQHLALQQILSPSLLLLFLLIGWRINLCQAVISSPGTSSVGVASE